jgi:large subunit ribosomal protein L4
VHGPRPRDYSYALPKKALLGALRSALSAKLADQKVTVVDAWQLESHKTRALLSALEKLHFTKSALLVSHGENRNLELASRNIEGVKLSAPNALQPYEVLKHDRLLLSKDAAARLVRSLDPEKKAAEVPDVATIAAAPAKTEAAAKKPAAKKTAKPAAKKGKG